MRKPGQGNKQGKRSAFDVSELTTGSISSSSWDNDDDLPLVPHVPVRATNIVHNMSSQHPAKSMTSPSQIAKKAHTPKKSSVTPSGKPASIAKSNASILDDAMFAPTFGSADSTDDDTDGDEEANTPTAHQKPLTQQHKSKPIKEKPGKQLTKPAVSTATVEDPALRKLRKVQGFEAIVGGTITLPAAAPVVEEENVETVDEGAKVAVSIVGKKEDAVSHIGAGAGSITEVMAGQTQDLLSKRIQFVQVREDGVVSHVMSRYFSDERVAL